MLAAFSALLDRRELDEETCRALTHREISAWAGLGVQKCVERLRKEGRLEELPLRAMMMRAGPVQQLLAGGAPPQGEFPGVVLKSIVLKGAHLKEANLRHANLRHANLRHADLWGADLEGANLEGVNLKGAVLIDAVLPDGYTPPDDAILQEDQRAVRDPGD